MKAARIAFGCMCNCALIMQAQEVESIDKKMVFRAVVIIAFVLCVYSNEMK